MNREASSQFSRTSCRPSASFPVRVLRFPIASGNRENAMLASLEETKRNGRSIAACARERTRETLVSHVSSTRRSVVAGGFILNPVLPFFSLASRPFFAPATQTGSTTSTRDFHRSSCSPGRVKRVDKLQALLRHHGDTKALFEALRRRLPCHRGPYCAVKSACSTSSFAQLRDVPVI